MNSQDANRVIEQMMRAIVSEHNSMRVIAKFGTSTYDITITKPEEVAMVETLLEKFKYSTKSSNYNLF